MRTHLASTVLLPIALFAVVPLSAHHSFAAEFDEHQPVTLNGTLTQFDWVFPHAWLHVDVKEPDGTVVNWAIEAGNPNVLWKQGLRKTDFPPGLEVVISGYRAKNGSATANGRSVTLADGRDFFLGSSSTGAPADEEERSGPGR